MKTTNKTPTTLLENIANAESEGRVGYEEEYIGLRKILPGHDEVMRIGEAVRKDQAELAIAVEEGLVFVARIVAAGRRWKLTEAGRERVKAARAAKSTYVAAVTDAGFDPDKKLSEMTPDEVAAFIAWNEEN